MKVKLLLIAAALLVFASAGYSQGFLSCLYETDQILTTRCGGTVPLADGTPVLIYWDANSNGPDASDVLAPLCALPPDCPAGPAGTHNLNTFPMNGLDVLGQAGQFMTDPCFLSVAQMTTPARYYLVINYLDVEGTVGHIVKYVSNVMTFTIPGVPQDFEAGPWSCTERDTSFYHCVPDLFTYFVPNRPHGEQVPTQHDCAVVCLEPGVHHVCVGPVVQADRIPHLYFLPGCSPTNTPCDSDCVPAFGWGWPVTPGGWAVVYPVMIQGALYYCADLTAGPNATDGCVCIWFDFIEPVGMGDIAVLPLDNAVKVTWKTLNAQEGVDRFEVLRNDVRVYSVNADHQATGHDYSYVDETVTNGTTYTYKLVVVNSDGTSEVLATEAVTPSFENGVVENYALYQNYPNPFNPTTRIVFDVKEANPVTLTIYNAMGQEVARLLNDVSYKAGRQHIDFDATSLTSGLYFYTVKIGNEFTATKKMLLVK